MKKMMRMALAVLSLTALAILIAPMISETAFADENAAPQQLEQTINDDTEVKGEDPAENTQNSIIEDENNQTVPEESATEEPAVEEPEQKTPAETVEENTGGTPVAVFSNQLESGTVKADTEVKVIVKNRSTTSCGVSASVRSGNAVAELFSGVFLEQLGNSGSNKALTFIADKEYFVSGENIIRVLFDYGTRKTVINLSLRIAEGEIIALSLGNENINIDDSVLVIDDAVGIDSKVKSTAKDRESNPVTIAATGAEKTIQQTETPGAYSAIEEGINIPLVELILLMIMALAAGLMILVTAGKRRNPLLDK